MEKSLAHTKWVCKYHIVFTPVFTPKYSVELHPSTGEKSYTISYEQIYKKISKIYASGKAWKS